MTLNVCAQGRFVSWKDTALYSFSRWTHTVPGMCTKCPKNIMPVMLVRCNYRVLHNIFLLPCKLSVMKEKTILEHSQSDRWCTITSLSHLDMQLFLSVGWRINRAWGGHSEPSPGVSDWTFQESFWLSLVLQLSISFCSCASFFCNNNKWYYTFLFKFQQSLVEQALVICVADF